MLYSLKRDALAIFVFCFCSMLACDDPQPVTIRPNTDMGPDQMVDTADSSFDMASDLADMMQTSSDSSLELDAAVMPMGGCVVPSSDALTSVPGSDRVQVLYTGFNSVLMWSDELGVHACDIDGNGKFSGAHRFILDEVSETPHQITAARVGPYGFVAMSKADMPIRLVRVDRPSASPMMIQNDGVALYGPATLSTVGSSLVVFGRTASGSIGWSVIKNSWTAPTIESISGFESIEIDDAVSVPSGIFLRFGGAGQCAFFDGQRYALVSSIPCSLGAGGFVGNGESARIWQVMRVESELYVSLESLFDQDAQLVMGKLETEALLTWPKVRGYQPLVARRIISEPSGRRGHLQLYLAGPDQLLESLTTWEGSWSFENAKAVHLRESNPQPGTCSGTDTECTLDEECFNGALCENRFDHMTADLVIFDPQNQPSLVPVGMQERTLLSTATIFDDDPNCVPVPEACDGRDQDCDDSADDGICCHVSQGRNDVSVEWISGAPVEEFHISDVGTESAYLVAYRAFEGLVSRWRGLTVTLNQRENGTHFDTIGNCNYPGGNCTEAWANSEHYPFAIDAGPGFGIMAIGGTRVLVARTDVADDAPWALYWIHAYRNHKPFVESDGPVILPDECDNLLLMEGLNRADGGESLVLVCPDRIIRAYPNPEKPDVTWRFDGPELGNLNQIEWATKLRNGFFGQHDRGFNLLVAFRSDFGNLALRAFRFVTEDEGPPILTPLNTLHPLLEGLGDADLTHPIYLNRDPDGPLIRIRDQINVEYANLIDGGGQEAIEWQKVQAGSAPSRVIYSQLAQQLVMYGQPNEDGSTPVFLSSTAVADGRTGMWSLEPTFQLPSNSVFSNTSQAFYNYNVFDVTLDPDGGDRSFNIRLVNLQCLAP